MSIYMPEERQYELAPAGTHVATCRLVVDIGTQEGQYGKKRQLVFGWELPDELTEEDNEPFRIYRRYTYTSDRRSALRTDIESWLGRVLTADDFGRLDLTEMLGRTCMIGIKHETRQDGRAVSSIASIMAPPRGTPARRPVIGEAISFSLEDRPLRLPEFEPRERWISELIQKSPEHARATGAKPAAGSPAERLRAHLATPAEKPAPKPEPDSDLDDEIPF
jgi:hypothetical protein